MQFYILTSTNYKALKRHFSSNYSNIEPKDAVVIINTLNKKYSQLAQNFCEKNNIEYYVTESNGTPSKGKNSLLDIFLKSDNEHCVMVDGDDFLTPHGVWMYKHLAKLPSPPDAVCLINQRSIRYSGKKCVSYKNFNVDYDYLGKQNYCKIFQDTHKLSLEKSKYFESLHHKYYSQQKKYSEPDEVHCRVTWLSKKAAKFKFNEDLVIGEDTLQMLRLKHEALEGRLNFYTTPEQPATYIYDECTAGTVMEHSKFGKDYEWMDDYLNALQKMKDNNQLHENVSLPELKIDYPQDYVSNDLKLTNIYWHKIKGFKLSLPKNASKESVRNHYELLKINQAA